MKLGSSLCPTLMLRRAAMGSSFERHSRVTYLAREGAAEQQMKAIGGWKSNVVSRYVHLAAKDAKGVLGEPR